MSVCNVTGSGRVLGSLTLPVQVSSYDGLRWSEDNQLAVSTKKGVYVFEISPDVRRNVNSLHFVKTFVQNETDMEPWQMKSVLAETELMSLERSLRSEVMMDRILSPHMAAGEVTFKQPSKVETFSLEKFQPKLSETFRLVGPHTQFLTVNVV